MLTWWQAVLLVVASMLGGALVRGLIDSRIAAGGDGREGRAAGPSDADRREATRRAWLHHNRVMKLAAMGDRGAFWEAYTEAQEWYAQNSQYLEQGARQATREGLHGAMMQLEILVSGSRDLRLRKENWDRLLECGAIIERSMNQLAGKESG
ncbi:MAG: hypothetical protein PVH50_11170 [Anaerolineae bacterium]|jgi:hypothetical protein